MTTSLSASVGYGGVNVSKDVEEVRLLIERHMMADLLFSYAIDGAQLSMAGMLLPGNGVLSSAIQIFQTDVMGKSESWADGLVSPGKQTWKALTGQVGSARINPMAASVLNPKIGLALGMVDKYQKFRQGDNTQKLGHRYDSNDDDKVDENDAWASIASHGCCLCTLTMAATGIGRPTKHWPKGLLAKDLIPDTANQIVKDGGGFYETGGLSTKDVPGLFGMSVQRYGPDYENNIDENALSLIDAHLANGNPIAAHVDYRRKQNYKGSKGDHWILITNKCNDPFRHYDAIDPASGTKMGMTKYSANNQRDFDLFMKKLNNDAFSYQPGVLYGVPSATGVCSERQRNKQKNYRMVRFLLLSPG